MVLQCMHLLQEVERGDHQEDETIFKDWWFVWLIEENNSVHKDRFEIQISWGTH